MRRNFLFLSRLALCFCLPSLAAISNAADVSPNAVVSEMNLARQQPALYATFVQQVRANFDGESYLLPGGTRIRAKEGAHAFEEAIQFLRSARPRQPFTFSEGMSRGAADHCADQASSGRRGHTGSDWSSPASRMNRYGSWGGRWGENIAYGKRSARDIVLALIINDGLPARKHRAIIFNPVFNFAGAAYGPHAAYRSVCSIKFAAVYKEEPSAPPASVATLVARNS